MGKPTCRLPSFPFDEGAHTVATTSKKTGYDGTMKLFVVLSLVATACAFAATGNREVSQNPLSPTAETQMKLAGNDVVVEYNAPSARNRKVEGGLIPYNTWYRMGADAATTLTTSGDLMMGNLLVPKGVHTLFLQAAATGDWMLIVSNETKQFGTDYDKTKDLGRIAMKVTKLPKAVEKFTLTLKATGEKAGTLSLDWGGSHAEVAIKGQ